MLADLQDVEQIESPTPQRRIWQADIAHDPLAGPGCAN